MSLTRKLSAIALSGIFLVSSATLLRAEDRDDKCGERVHKAERALQNAERKHGEHSRQAEKKRHDLEEARDKCGHRDHDDHRDNH